VVIEFEDEINRLYKDIEGKDILLLPIYSNYTLHPRNNKISIILLKIIDDGECYIISKSHNECVSVFNNDMLKNIIDSSNNVYVYDKKYFLHCVDDITLKLIDIGLLYYISNNKRLDINADVIKSEQHIKSIYSKFQNIIDSIPIYQLCDKYKDSISILENIVLENKHHIETEYFNKLNYDTINSYYLIEKNGVTVDEDMFLTYYEKSKKHIDKNNLIYSDYNMYTSTGRPSNAFANINFGALNKNNGVRNSIVSRFPDGLMLLFDYDAFHLRLISKLIDYTVPDRNFHRYLGKIYYGKDDITDEEYEMSKKMTFTFLYSDEIYNAAKEIDYFKDIPKFIQSIYTRL